MQDADKVFLEYVVKALVDNPNDVKIDRTVDEMGVLISLSVNPADMGKIIGRMGNTAKAIRTLLRIIGMKNNARVNLKINEPEGSTRPERPMGSTPSMSSTPTMKTVDQAMEDLKGI
ncbi:MAG: KH domain-containing protein [Patescibacteria group bacterium]